MARTLGLAFNTTRRNISLTATRCVKGMDDPIEHATGLEKKELLAKLAGNENPFQMGMIKRGPGTKDCPTLIPSAFDKRLVGCYCDEEAFNAGYMWLHKGHPKRCECGHWFALTPYTGIM